MKRIIFILSILILQSSLSVMDAQPQKSRTARSNIRKNGNNKSTSGTTTTVSRADLMFPTAVAVPEEVVWRRDLYRILDLKQNENAPLYFPVQPHGNQMNLFTLIFKLFSTGKLPVYEYNLDGVEDFSAAKRMHFKDFLTKNSIFYEMEGNNYKINDADIPSAEVLRYYIKESSYFDQGTATYHSRVTAICPVAMRADEFSSYGSGNDDSSLRPYPLCWIKYDDLATFLSGHTLMVSDINNASTMSMADFFETNHYKGKIYMTSNMQGKSLQEQVVPDSTGNTKVGMQKLQNKIEKEMSDFEEHIWNAPVDSAELARQDSIAKAQASTKGKKSVVASNKTRRGQTSTGNTTTQKSTKKEKTPKAASSGSKISVRRQRH